MRTRLARNLFETEDETMLIVAVAWLYVALMMAVAEATHANGSVLGALITFVLYGLVPVGLVLYIGSTKIRARARALAAQRAEAAAAPAGSGHAPDAGGHAAGVAVAPERKEP
jgi:hypothetical protein